MVRVKNSFIWLHNNGSAHLLSLAITAVPQLVLGSAPSVPQSVVQSLTSAFTFMTLLRHYAKQALTPR